MQAIVCGALCAPRPVQPDDVPTLKLQSKPHSCTDAPGWNVNGITCRNLEDWGVCELGAVTDRYHFFKTWSWQFDHPERNCCACGRLQAKLQKKEVTAPIKKPRGPIKGDIVKMLADTTFCWMIYKVGAEDAMVEYMYNNSMGVFACDSHAVFSFFDLSDPIQAMCKHGPSTGKRDGCKVAPDGPAALPLLHKTSSLPPLDQEMATVPWLSVRKGRADVARPAHQLTERQALARAQVARAQVAQVQAQQSSRILQARFPEEHRIPRCYAQDTCIWHGAKCCSTPTGQGFCVSPDLVCCDGKCLLRDRHIGENATSANATRMPVPSLRPATIESDPSNPGAAVRRASRNRSNGVSNGVRDEEKRIAEEQEKNRETSEADTRRTNQETERQRKTVDEATKKIAEANRDMDMANKEVVKAQKENEIQAAEGEEGMDIDQTASSILEPIDKGPAIDDPKAVTHCVSVDPERISDDWCKNACNSDLAIATAAATEDTSDICPPTLCKCGAQAQWAGEAKDLDVHQGTAAYSNTKLFLTAWRKLFKESDVFNHEWVVKVDADTVFLAGRLRNWLPPAATAPLKVANCDVPIAADTPTVPLMYGSMEIINVAAARSFWTGMRDCELGIPIDHGEARFLHECAEQLKWEVWSEGAEAKSMIIDAFCEDSYQPGCGHESVAFHPFRNVHDFAACFKEAKASDRSAASDVPERVVWGELQVPDMIPGTVTRPPPLPPPTPVRSSPPPNPPLLQPSPAPATPPDPPPPPPAPSSPTPCSPPCPSSPSPTPTPAPSPSPSPQVNWTDAAEAGLAEAEAEAVAVAAAEAAAAGEAARVQVTEPQAGSSKRSSQQQQQQQQPQQQPQPQQQQQQQQQHTKWAPGLPQCVREHRTKMNSWYLDAGRNATQTDCAYVCNVERSEWCVTSEFSALRDGTCKMYDDCAAWSPGVQRLAYTDTPVVNYAA